MSRADPRQIGRVRHVLGATVTIELDPALAGVAPIWAGHLQSVGQVGSIVRIPQGPITLLASVTLVGLAEITGPLPPGRMAETGERWLQAQLLGEVDGLGVFRRGVSAYPALDDPVLFATPGELRAVFPEEGPGRVRIGHLAATPDVSYTLDAARMVVRHAAIVGSTGAGKSSTVSMLLQRMAASWPSANIVVVDPHGEYPAAMAGLASVRSVLGAGDELLKVPYWALPASDILTAFVGHVAGATTTSRFNELVTDERRAFSKTAPWVNVPEPMITADTPIPFDIRQVWYKLDYENHATYPKTKGEGDPEEISKGDPDKLVPAQFRPYGPGGSPPVQGPRFNVHGSVPERLRLRLLDPRFAFLRAPDSKAATTGDPLGEVVDDWLGGERPVSVLDFSGVPSEAADLAIGLVLQLILEIAVRSERDGIGRARPVLIVLEEAHRYLGEGATVRAARDSANRVAREGRKHGVGLVLVTQRPAELPATALSQVGTILALRLTNSEDQSTVKRALPDAVAGLADALPALRTGEAIATGEAVALPSRVVIDPPAPPPSASDPTLDGWSAAAASNDLSRPLARWRGEAEGGNDD